MGELGRVWGEGGGGRRKKKGGGYRGTHVDRLWSTWSRGEGGVADLVSWTLRLEAGGRGRGEEACRALATTHVLRALGWQFVSCATPRRRQRRCAWARWSKQQDS